MNAPTSHQNPPAPGLAPFTPRQAATLLAALQHWEARSHTPRVREVAAAVTDQIAAACGPALDAEETAELLVQLRALICGMPLPLVDAPARRHVYTAPVYTYLDASLGHTTAVDRELLIAHEIVCDQHREYGFWVYVAQDGHADQATNLIRHGFSETFRAVVAHAHALGCAWVFFDCDAEPIAGIDAPGHLPDAGTEGGA